MIVLCEKFTKRLLTIGFLVDSEIVLSTRYGKTMVFINKTLSTETVYQQDLINIDLISTSLIVGKVGSGMWCDKSNSTSNVNFFFEKQKSSQIFTVTHRDRGNNRNTHYPGNWIVSIRVRTVDIRMVLSTVG